MTEIFERRAVCLHRNRAAANMGRVAPVLDDLAGRLLDRLDDVKSRFTMALEIGGRGSIAGQLAARGMTVFSTDVSPRLAAKARDMAAAADPEALPFGARTFDLIIAHCSLHWVNDLPGALIQLRRALKPEGLFLASMPVLGTLAELRTALLDAEYRLTGAVNPRVSPYPDLRDCAGLLQRAGFALPVADVEEIEFLYASPLDLLHELRAAGETNAVAARSRVFAPRGLFPAALNQLPVKDGRTITTLRLAVMTGWGSAS